MLNPTIGKGPDAIAFGVEKVKSDPAGVIGPWFMALIGLTFMMGLLAIQVIRYFCTFGYESRGLFAVVVACVIMALTQWIIVVQGCWDWFVVHYGTWEIFAIAPWQAWSSPIINQVTVAVAQFFFAHRCYTLYGRNKMVLGGLIVGMLTAVALFTVVGIAIAVDPYNFIFVKRWNISALCVNLATDLAIASMTFWKLGGHNGETYSSNTNEVLQRLRKLTIEAAVPPAICALLNMALYLSLGSKNWVFTWFAIMTPQFYIWSLMLTLNSRLTIRQTFNAPNDEEAVSTHFEFANHLSSNQKRRQTDTGRTTVVFAKMTGTTCVPNTSMDLVDERVVGCDENGRGGDLDSKEYDDSVAGRSRSELQVDLDRWDVSQTEAPLRALPESVASLSTGDESSPEPPPARAISSMGRQPHDTTSI